VPERAWGFESPLSHPETDEPRGNPRLLTGQVALLSEEVLPEVLWSEWKERP
jgi:hypothetical protein